MKKTVRTLVGTAVGMTTWLMPFVVFAEQQAKSGDTNELDVKIAAYIGAGLAVSLGVLGGTLSQGRAAAAALDGIARNPGAAAKIQTPMILGLALIESLVLLSFLIAYLLQSK